MTKKFWAFIGNDKYDIGITDRTVTFMIKVALNLQLSRILHTHIRR